MADLDQYPEELIGWDIRALPMQEMRQIMTSPSLGDAVLQKEI